MDYACAPENHFYEEVAQSNDHPETRRYKQKSQNNSPAPELPMRRTDLTVNNISQRVQPNFSITHGSKNPVYDEAIKTEHNPPIEDGVKDTALNGNKYEEKNNKTRGKLNKAFAVEETDQVNTDDDESPAPNCGVEELVKL